MPHLHITYRDLTLFDGEVDEFTMTEAANGISVTGKTKKASGGLMEQLLAGARRAAQTAPTEETND